jgi:hypothetical protein
MSSHSTSYQGRFVDTPETQIVDKPAEELLIIELQRCGGRMRIAGVR